MKYLLLLVLLLLTFSTVLADKPIEIKVCRETMDEAFLEEYSGWGFAGTEVILTFSGIDWNSESPGWTGEAISGTGVGDLTVWADGGAMFAYWDGTTYQVTEGNAGTVNCDEVFEGDAPSIPIPVTTDCSHIEISNGDGGWSLVESGGEPVLLHYGESLIGSHNQSDDPVDYRPIPVDCY